MLVLTGFPHNDMVLEYLELKFSSSLELIQHDYQINRYHIMVLSTDLCFVGPNGFE